MKIVNRLLNGTLIICGLTFLGFSFILIFYNSSNSLDLNIIAQLLVVTLIIVAGLIWVKGKLAINPNEADNLENTEDLKRSSQQVPSYKISGTIQISIVKEILRDIVKYCGYTLFVFILVIAITIICKSAITNFILITSAAVVIITFATLMFTLWIIKEMQPEEIKRDMRILDLIKQEKKDCSNEELSNKFDALKEAVSEIIKMLKK